MDIRENIEEIQMYKQQIKEVFKSSVTDEFYDTWADSFEIDYIDDKKVFVTYYGTEDIKVFKKKCKETLAFCVCSVMGDVKKIKISDKHNYKPLSPKTKKNIKPFPQNTKLW